MAKKKENLSFVFVIDEKCGDSHTSQGSNSETGLVFCRNVCAGNGEYLVQTIFYPPAWEATQVPLQTSNKTPLVPIGVEESSEPPRY